MRLTKMHGAGNDYVYATTFEQPITGDLPELARVLAHRHTGVGGDGLIVLFPSDIADARMRMFNADGSEAEMCGNGLRCAVKLLVDRGFCVGPIVRVETLAGVLESEVISSAGRESLIRVDLGKPRLTADEVPTTLPLNGDPPGAVVGATLEVAGQSLEVTGVSMGNPHCVVFVDEATDDLVLGVGPQIERHPVFPEGVNVEFVEVTSRGELRQRTWERGSGETGACGTGAAAVCVAGVLTGRTDREVLIHLRGGDLKLNWDGATGHVHKTGPAVEVFTCQCDD
ncbi:MAG: diaminopimelate epimerase [Planctomycetota bacterium]